MKVYFIDSVNRAISARIIESSEDIRRLLGGYMETAFNFANGDVLYVDEEGMLKGNEYFFRFSQRPDQPFAGHGVLVGTEIGDTSICNDPKTTLTQLRNKISFLHAPLPHENRVTYTISNLIVQSLYQISNRLNSPATIGKDDQVKLATALNDILVRIENGLNN